MRSYSQDDKRTIIGKRKMGVFWLSIQVLDGRWYERLVFWVMLKVHMYLAHYSTSPDSWLFEVRTSVPRPKVHVIGRDAYSGALRQALHPSIFCDTVGEVLPITGSCVLAGRTRHSRMKSEHTARMGLYFMHFQRRCTCQAPLRLARIHIPHNSSF
jgi:hypothetical protein